MELSKYLRDYSRTIPGKQQLLIGAYAKALEVIPRQLCDNAGFDATNILNKLRAKHAQVGWRKYSCIILWNKQSAERTFVPLRMWRKWSCCNVTVLCVCVVLLQGGMWYGVDINNEDIADNFTNCVWEPSIVRINALTAASEAACLILSVDETIKNPRSSMDGPPGGAGRGRGRGRPHAHWKKARTNPLLNWCYGPPCSV